MSPRERRIGSPALRRVPGLPVGWLGIANHALWTPDESPMAGIASEVQAHHERSDRRSLRLATLGGDGPDPMAAGGALP